jgi:tetratricopeptide (TPR) repeat protein
VIRLLNRRFVNFFYNTDAGPPQPNYKGKDRDAKAFLANKTPNKYAYYGAFTAQGEAIGVTDVYASKDTVFDFLVELLKLNPEFDKFTTAEQAVLQKADAELGNATAQLEAGRLMEELGRYDASRGYLAKVVQPGVAASLQADAYRLLLSMARYQQRWDELERLCVEVEKNAQAKKLGLAADLAAERGYHLKARKDYAAWRELMEKTIKLYPTSKRTSELHFHAGVASFFLQDKPRAYYHWCWVVENLPDDHLARRCYLAAAHEGMPYKNPELDNYSAPLNGGQTVVIQAAYDRAKAAYREMKGREGARN